MAIIAITPLFHIDAIITLTLILMPLTLRHYYYAIADTPLLLLPLLRHY
jgi:hypothetical protein